MDRRKFLQLAGAAPLALSMAPGLLAAPLKGAGAAGWDKYLVVVELKGGNDGLNTVIPYATKEYYSLRPRLGIERDTVLQLGNGLGFHPGLEPLMKSWEAKDLAVALGVGYPEPNRSHFRSIEIWETASSSGEFLSDGWIARLMSGGSAPKGLIAEGVVIGQDDIGPLMGTGIRTITMNTPQDFVNKAKKVEVPHEVRRNAALDHILETQKEIRGASDDLETRIKKVPAMKTGFPGNGFGRQLETAAKLIASKTPCAVIKVSLGGFDTHANQLGTHARLMGELAGGLAAFRDAMQEVGMWDNVLVMTYSEFGRRAGENNSRGTDHGTAAPHFLMGGKVRGGFVGEQPSLVNLENKDLVYNLDYRQMYATVAQKWWGLNPESTLEGNYRALDCVSA